MLIGAVSLPSLEYLYRSVPLISWQIPQRRNSQFSTSPHCTATHKQLLSCLSACRSVAYSKDLWSMCNPYTNSTAPCGGLYLFSGMDNHHLLKSFFLSTLLLEAISPILSLPELWLRNLLSFCVVPVFFSPLLATSGHLDMSAKSAKLQRQLVWGLDSRKALILRTFALYPRADWICPPACPLCYTMEWRGAILWIQHSPYPPFPAQVNSQPLLLLLQPPSERALIKTPEGGGDALKLS